MSGIPAWLTHKNRRSRAIRPQSAVHALQRAEAETRRFSYHAATRQESQWRQRLKRQRRQCGLAGVGELFTLVPV